MILVSNASPLINISGLKLFQHLPALYDKLLIPEAVFKEVVKTGTGRSGAKKVSDGLKSGFIDRRQVGNILAVSALSEFIGDGESEAIILASEISADAIILDDNKARNIAHSMNLNVIGTIGILLALKERNIISEIRPYLIKAVSSGFRISTRLFIKVLGLMIKASAPRDIASSASLYPV